MKRDNPATEQARRFTLTVEPGDRGTRLDRFLAERLKEAGLSRERLKTLVRDGQAFVDGVAERSPRAILRDGSEVTLTVELPPVSLSAEAGDLEILYRDAVLAVINKPAGLVTHPAPGLRSGTLVHRLLAHFPELAGQRDGQTGWQTDYRAGDQTGDRPGIAHRLDKDTSGLMLVALSEECRLALADMFARHDIHKEYLALVRGVPDAAEGLIDAPVGRHPTVKTRMAVTPGGKKAKSAWRVLRADPDGAFALVCVRIFSGRTHQVRVHMAHIGHPLLGDAVYGGPASGPARRQMLHAWKLALNHPLPEKADAPGSGSLAFCCPPPQDFMDTAAALCRKALRVVVTGSPGCGKSALLARLKERGLPVFSADACVAALYGPGGDGRHLLAARYGDRFVPGPGEPVDKAALGAAMRQDDAVRREVEAMLHPLVFAALQAFWQEHEGAEIMVAEIPLYLECGRDARTPPHERPVLVGVRCPFAIRRERLERNRGWTEETVARVESWQWPEDKKMAACDIVIDNSGTLEQLDAETQALLGELDALRRRKNEEAAAALAACWRCPDD